MTKTERAELKSLIRQQFKVLRKEVAQRAAEMTVQLDNEVDAKFSEFDRRWSDAMFLAQEAEREANRKVNDIFRELIDQPDGRYEFVLIHLQAPPKPNQERHNLQRRAFMRVQADVKAAHLALDRQEADLLRRLAVGALDSADAREFIQAIPTVGDLVPVARLAELEAELGDG